MADTHGVAALVVLYVLREGCTPFNEFNKPSNSTRGVCASVQLAYACRCPLASSTALTTAVFPVAGLVGCGREMRKKENVLGIYCIHGNHTENVSNGQASRPAYVTIGTIPHVAN